MTTVTTDHCDSCHSGIQSEKNLPMLIVDTLSTVTAKMA